MGESAVLVLQGLFSGCNRRVCPTGPGSMDPVHWVTGGDGAMGAAVIWDPKGFLQVSVSTRSSYGGGDGAPRDKGVVE